MSTSFELEIPSEVRPQEWKEAFASHEDAASPGEGADLDLDSLEVGAPLLPEGQGAPSYPPTDLSSEPLGLDGSPDGSGDAPRFPEFPGDGAELTVSELAFSGESDTGRLLEAPQHARRRLEALAVEGRTAAELRRALAEQRRALAEERAQVAEELRTLHLRIQHAVDGAVASARANLDREREDLARDRAHLERDREALEADREQFESDRLALKELADALTAHREALEQEIRERLAAEAAAAKAALEAELAGARRKLAKAKKRIAKLSRHLSESERTRVSTASGLEPAATETPRGRLRAREGSRTSSEPASRSARRSGRAGKARGASEASSKAKARPRAPKRRRRRLG
ncbi:MAG: hypothetical protein D6731_08090 [Planctomycetota bacterium]|nr:MAG: hypothetical protein D6731_08090 [Planctomycetota bacterium]